jgi:hypothetical protein
MQVKDQTSEFRCGLVSKDLALPFLHLVFSTLLTQFVPCVVIDASQFREPAPFVNLRPSNDTMP